MAISCKFGSNCKLPMEPACPRQQRSVSFVVAVNSVFTRPVDTRRVAAQCNGGSAVCRLESGGGDNRSRDFTPTP